MTPPDKTIHFTFASHPTKSAELRWKANLTFPAGATDNTPLPLTIVDGNDKPISSGIFEFAGQRLKIVDGKSSLTYLEFIAGKHDVPLWLYRKDLLPIPGGMTFE